jgi:hypothetical protein
MQGITTWRVTATIEYKDGRVEYKNWTGKRGVPSLHRAIRAAYPSAKMIQFGKAIATNSYGAH